MFESDLLKINEDITLQKVYKRLHDGGQVRAPP